jgi:phosphoglycerate dehydrogenase-like oxidoreductase
MAKKIGVIIDFLNDKYERQLNAAAAKYGYEIEYFPSSAEAVGRVDDCEILYGHCSQKVIRSAKSLKWYCCCWAGVDHFCDESLYQNPDCRLTNSSGAYGTTISEHLIMVCLMLLRRQMEYTEIIREGGWRVLPGGIHSLHGARVTCLGTGDIGTEFARRVRAFHPASLTGVSRSGRANADFDTVHPVTELNQLLPETDLLFMSLPSVSDTVNILNAERMALLPKGAYVVNVGRGTAIDQDALIAALDSGHLAGAALDVVVPEPLPADHPLRKAKNLLLTPHVAGNMTLGYTCERNVQLFCENLENYAAGRPMHHLVDRRKGY